MLLRLLEMLLLGHIFFPHWSWSNIFGSCVITIVFAFSLFFQNVKRLSYTESIIYAPKRSVMLICILWAVTRESRSRGAILLSFPRQENLNVFSHPQAPPHTLLEPQ
jgi:hypothetical protein